MNKKISNILDCIEYCPLPVRGEEVQSAEKTEKIVNLTMKKIYEEKAAQFSHAPWRARRGSAYVAAAVIITLLLGAVTALAFTNNWGIVEFFRIGSGNSSVLPEAVDIIQPNPVQDGGIVDIVASEQSQSGVKPAAQVEVSNQVIFSVREAVFDSISVYLVIEVQPTNPDCLVLAMDAEETDYINAGIDTGGKTFIHAYVRVPTQDGTASGNYAIEHDGTFVFYWGFPYEDNSPEITLELICGVLIDNATGSGDIGSIDWEELRATMTSEEFDEFAREIRRIEVNNQIDKIESTLLVTVQNTGATKVTNVEPIYMIGSGIRIDSVTLTGSEMSTRVKIECTVIDEAVYGQIADELFFGFIDENGELISGGSAGSGMTYFDIGLSQFSSEFSIRAFEKMPNTITVQTYNMWDKSMVYDSQVILLN